MAYSIHCYIQMAGERVAKKRLSKILDTTDVIGYMPTIGQLDEDNKHTPTYRYITVLGYRIYYFTEEEVINIAAIWDCRQGGRVFDDNR